MERAGRNAPTAIALAVAMWVGSACNRTGEGPAPAAEHQILREAPASERVAPENPRAEERETMVREQIAGRDVRDERVLAAMRAVPRHELVPEEVRHLAYHDRPISIGEGQTISQPYIVAKMTELAGVGPKDRCLEVGTGSGYQAAILAEIGCEVYSIEIVEPLGLRAARDLARLGYGDRIQTRIGDGYSGWPEAAPFDAILVTAAPPRIPRPLLDQLRDGGRLVVPVGESSQVLRVLTRRNGDIEDRRIFPVRFVPMTGEVRSGTEN